MESKIVCERESARERNRERERERERGKETCTAVEKHTRMHTIVGAYARTIVMTTVRRLTSVTDWGMSIDTWQWKRPDYVLN